MTTRIRTALRTAMLAAATAGLLASCLGAEHRFVDDNGYLGDPHRLHRMDDGGYRPSAR